MENLRDAPRLKIEASEHAARGLATCTYLGVIVWRGALTEFPSSASPSFDVIYCHDNDVEQVRKILEPGRKLRGEAISLREKRPSG